jgi:hypothetical protein
MLACMQWVACRRSTLPVLALGLSLLLPPGAALGQAPASPPAVKAAPIKDFQTHMAAAVRLYEQLEYERALEELASAEGLAQEATQVGEVAISRGLIFADRGYRKESLAAFRSGLILKPAAKLPGSVSPKVAQDFESVREALRRAQAQRAVPPAPVAPDVKDRPVLPEKEPALVPPPPSLAQPPAFQPGPSPERPARRWLLPATLAGTSVVAGAVGGYFGLQSRDQVQGAREALLQSERVSALESARGSARAANVLFAVAGAAAAGALITFFTQGSEAPSPGGAP